MERKPLPRLLMLLYFYPPIESVGVRRNVAFAENLLQLGWSPTVITVTRAKEPWLKTGDGRPPAGIPVIRVPELNVGGVADFCHAVLLRICRIFGRELRRNVFRDLLCIPDAQWSWFAAWKAIPLARRSDAVFVSCTPFSAAVQGVITSAVTRCPLILDLRDPWVAPGASRLHRLLSGWLERICVRAAGAVILNTPSARLSYRERFPDCADKMRYIPNGYDRLTPAPELSPAERFRIVHVGTFYGDRSPRLLLDVLAELGNPDIEFVQVGEVSPELTEYVGRIPMAIVGPVSHEEAVEWMRRGSLLYLKQGHSYRTAVAAKTFEYLATGRPILAECPPGDNADIVSRYAARTYVVTTNSREDLKNGVLRAYSERALPSGVTEQFKVDFNRIALTQQLADLLDQTRGATAQAS